MERPTHPGGPDMFSSGAFGLACVLLLAGSGVAAGSEPSVERKTELLHRLKHDCGSCHGLTMKGGLGPPLLPARLAERTRDDLAATILDGVAGTPMPPWQGELTIEEARWIARILQEGVPR